MKNWKTSLFGFLAALPALAHTFNVPTVGHIGSGDVFSLVGGIGALLFGLYAKDNNVTGGDVKQ